MHHLTERVAFELSLRSPWLFRHFVRKELYRRNRDETYPKGNPEKVHAEALAMLNEHVDILAEREADFYFPELIVTIKGKEMSAFGTAAGMDKNADALVPFSYLFGYQKPGTVVLDERFGNAEPRVAADEENDDLYNAQGFPSKGTNYVKANLHKFRNMKNSSQYKTFGPLGYRPVIVSICGLPYVVRETGAASFRPNPNRKVIAQTENIVIFKEFMDFSESETEKALENARTDTSVLLNELSPYADGFEWNVFTPNTKTVQLLRKPDIFRGYAKLARPYAGNKITLAKMGPYEEAGKKEWLSLAGAWLEGGGDGITAVNTSAGKSGRSLRPYRLRAVKDARTEFPDTIIFAAGGVFGGDDAYKTFEAGADALDGYTPYTFYGLGLARKMMKGVSASLKARGYKDLDQLRVAVKESAWLRQRIS